MCQQHDQLSKLLYVAEMRNGAQAIMTTALAKLPIRVFRSSSAQGPWQVSLSAVQQNEKNQTWYRYEGLFQVLLHKDHILQVNHDASISFYFHLERVGLGRHDNFRNAISNREFREYHAATGSHRNIDQPPSLQLVENMEQWNSCSQITVSSKRRSSAQQQSSSVEQECDNKLVFQLAYKQNVDESGNAYQSLHAAYLLCKLKNDPKEIDDEIKYHLYRLRKLNSTFQYVVR
jgi:hypothetical protein